jgi:hypothetical protein
MSKMLRNGVLLARAVVLITGLGATTLTAAITIGGVTYNTGAPTETLTAPFNSPTGVPTVNQYAGYVLVTVTGFGMSQGTNENDAFYVFADGAGNPVTPAHDPNFYQVRYNNAAMATLQPQFDAYRFIVYDNNSMTPVTPPYTPAYQAAHSYSFAVPVPGTVPTNLFFGTSDGQFNDNTGAFTITITQLVAQPAILKTFAPATILPNGTSTASFTITNSDPSNAYTNVAFSDPLPGAMMVAAVPNITGNCNGGTVTATGGTISLTGGSLAAGTSCTVTVNVTAPEGSYTNIVTATVTGAGTALESLPSSATLSVASSPVLSKSFGAVSIGVPNTTTLTLTLSNPNHTTTLTGLTFGDTLPVGLVVSTPNALTTTCSGVVTATAGGVMIQESGGSLAPGASCTITLKVTATGSALGLLTNVTSTVTSVQAIPGSPATATIFIGDPLQISYVANLAAGDSVVDITNTGASGAGLASGTTASTTGAICANVYAFTPDEQLVSCCSCPVTPNGLVSLSAKNDLASNTLTPAVPTALVVKVLATLPVANSCNNSAAAVTTNPLANGIKAFGSKIHATPVAGSYGVTEVPFSPVTLSAGELTRIGNLCNFIIANGSGFGICRSCQLGGLGAVRE